MTKDQEEHLAHIQAYFAGAVGRKYRAGQAEHGGNLWDNPVMTLLDMAIEEAVDQVTYLVTLRSKLFPDVFKTMMQRMDEARVPAGSAPKLIDYSCRACGKQFSSTDPIRWLSINRIPTLTHFFCSNECLTQWCNEGR